MADYALGFGEALLLLSFLTFESSATPIWPKDCWLPFGIRKPPLSDTKETSFLLVSSRSMHLLTSASVCYALFLCMVSSFCKLKFMFLRTSSLSLRCLLSSIIFLRSLSHSSYFADHFSSKEQTLIEEIPIDFMLFCRVESSNSSYWFFDSTSLKYGKWFSSVCFKTINVTNS